MAAGSPRTRLLAVNQIAARVTCARDRLERD